MPPIIPNLEKPYNLINEKIFFKLSIFFELKKLYGFSEIFIQQ